MKNDTPETGDAKTRSTVEAVTGQGGPATCSQCWQCDAFSPAPLGSGTRHSPPGGANPWRTVFSVTVRSTQNCCR
jgi:hypothetical protein